VESEIASSADSVVVGGQEMWRALASMWVDCCAEKRDLPAICDAVVNAIMGINKRTPTLDEPIGLESVSGDHVEMPPSSPARATQKELF